MSIRLPHHQFVLEFFCIFSTSTRVTNSEEKGNGSIYSSLHFIYRHPSICILFSSRFTSYNKQIHSILSSASGIQPVPSRCSTPGNSWDHLTSKVDIILAKAAGLLINLNIDGVPIRSRSLIEHSPLALSNLSSLILVPILRSPLPPINPVCVQCPRLLDPSVLEFSLP